MKINDSLIKLLFIFIFLIGFIFVPQAESASIMPGCYTGRGACGGGGGGGEEFTVGEQVAICQASPENTQDCIQIFCVENITGDTYDENEINQICQALGYTAPAPAPTPEPNPVPEPTSDPQPIPVPDAPIVKTEVKMAEISKVTLPESFHQENSATTDLTKIKEEESKNINNFILDNSQINKITWLEPLDLSEPSLKEKFEKLDQYVILDQIGKVEINSGEIPQLNKKARIEMKGLKLILKEGEAPLILKNNEPAKEDEVIKITYENSVLAFEVNGFSEYSIAPNIYTDIISSETEEKNYKITGSVDDLEAKVIVRVNEKNYETAVNKENGSFELEIPLEIGENSITIEAEGKNGKKSQVLLNIDRVNPPFWEKIDKKLLIGLSFVLILGLFAIVLWLFKKKSHQKIVS